MTYEVTSRSSERRVDEVERSGMVSWIKDHVRVLIKHSIILSALGKDFD